jgi:hypothetical protein
VPGVLLGVLVVEGGVFATVVASKIHNAMKDSAAWAETRAVEDKKTKPKSLMTMSEAGPRHFCMWQPHLPCKTPVNINCDKYMF